MRQLLEETKEKYIKFKSNEKELEEELIKLKDEELTIEMEFDERYSSCEILRRKFFRKNTELNKKKEKYMNKKYRRALLIIAASYFIPLVIVNIILDTLILHLVCLTFASIVGLITAVKINKNEKTKYKEEFESQEETRRLKNEINEIQQKYNQQEKELNVIRTKLREHRNKVSKTERDINNIRNSIRLLQHNTYEDLLGLNQTQEEEQKLTLK